MEIKKAEPKKPNSAPPSSKRYNDSRSSYSSGGYGDAYDGFGGSFGMGGGYRSGGAYGGGRGSGASDGLWRRWPAATVVEDVPFHFFDDSAI